MSLTIRHERPGEAAAIERVTIEAFKSAPRTDHTEHFIVRELRWANALAASIVAEVNRQIVGHVAVSPIQISNGVDQWFGLGPISVLPVHQGKGIGSQLMAAALEHLRQTSARGCVVLGNPDFYGRFGFLSIPGLVLPGVPVEHFLAIAMDSSNPQGTVTYHQAFQSKQ